MEKLAKPGQYLTFRLKGQTYGVPIGSVREINRLTKIIEVPQTPAFVAGVINLRGKVIPIVTLRLKFGLENTEHTKNTCIIVIDGECGQVGMIVDQVSGVMDLVDEQIEATPEIGDAAKLRHVIGMAKANDTVIILVDVARTLSKEELSGCLPTEEAA